MANSLGNLGNIYDILGQYDKAIDHHTRSLAINRDRRSARRANTMERWH